MNDGQWWDRMWSIGAGCIGCKAHCWAMRDAWRMAHNPNPKIAARYAGLVRKDDAGLHWTGEVRTFLDKLVEPLHWRKAQRIFVAPMTDLFLLPDKFLWEVFARFQYANQHTYFVFTKQPMLMKSAIERYRAEGEALCSPAAYEFPNVCWCVSCCDQNDVDRMVPILRHTPAATRGVSLEPLLSEIRICTCVQCGAATLRQDCPLHGLHKLSWIVVGSESGPNARPCDVAWIRCVVQQCKAAGVPCWVKQFGSNPWQGNANGNCRNPGCTHPDCGYVRMKLRDRNGRNMSEWPRDLRVRELPEVKS